MTREILSGTWREGDGNLVEQDVQLVMNDTPLIESGEDVFVSKENPETGGWEPLGTMKAFGNIEIGEGMHLMHENGDSNLNTGKIEFADVETHHVIVHTARSKYSLEIMPKETSNRPSLTVGSIASGFSRMIRDAFKGY